jgi:hypothetical protein
MTNRPLLLRRLGTSLMIVLTAAATVDGTSGHRNGTGQRTAALDLFQQRVEAYADLHRQLGASHPPLGSRIDQRRLTFGRGSLAPAIIAARATARQGDIFTADEVGHLLPGIHPEIHAQCPLLEMRELSASTLSMLPMLPSEPAYRVVDYDLVLGT